MGLETAVVLTLAAGAVSAVGSLNAAAAQADAYEYQAAVDERNAKLAEQDRLQAIRTSQIEAQDKRRENLRILASSRAAYGASGVELSGSPLEALTDSSIEMALDTRRVEYEGQVRAREGAVQILGLEESADVNRASASDARSAGVINAGASLLSAGSSAARIGASA